jgi:hypothetical protein
LQRAERFAASQDGVLDRTQAITAGLSPSQILTATRGGRWVRVASAVYRVAGAPDTPQQRARIAFLSCHRSGGLLSHVSGAAEAGLLAVPSWPDITVPSRASARSGVARVHRSEVPAVDRMHRRGMVFTSVSRTIVDLAAGGDRATLESVVDAAFCRKLANAASVTAAADRIPGGRAGKALVRDVIAVWTPGVEPGSVAEVRLIRACATEGITGLVCQHDVYDDSGRFLARLDLAQPELRRGFEYDGLEPHSPRAWERDEARYARLRALGWEIESITKLDLLPGERRLRTIADRWLRRVA